MLARRLRRRPNIKTTVEMYRLRFQVLNQLKLMTVNRIIRILGFFIIGNIFCHLKLEIAWELPNLKWMRNVNQAFNRTRVMCSYLHLVVGTTPLPQLVGLTSRVRETLAVVFVCAYVSFLGFSPHCVSVAADTRRPHLWTSACTTPTKEPTNSCEASEYMVVEDWQWCLKCTRRGDCERAEL